jgi:hypothetical protein
MRKKLQLDNSVGISIEGNKTVVLLRFVFIWKGFVDFDKVSPAFMVQRLRIGVVNEVQLDKIFEFLLEMWNDFSANAVGAIKTAILHLCTVEIFHALLVVRAEVFPVKGSEFLWVDCLLFHIFGLYLSVV